jgi:hypothetical protein
MNRCLTFSLVIPMTLSTLAIPLRAANKSRAGKTEQTNEELEKLRRLRPQPQSSVNPAPQKAQPPLRCSALREYAES